MVILTLHKKAKDILNFTGADAVMLGRATQGNPWLISQINEFLTEGSHREELSLEKKIPQVLKHIKQIHDFYGHKNGNTSFPEKHIFWYSMHLDREKGSAFWPNINRVTDHSEQYSKIS